MNKETISFETAKLAKEKGFDWPSRHCYQGDDPKGYDFFHETVNSPVNYNEKGYHGNGRPLYSAPTQSQLQTWLRDNHNVDIIIEPMFDAHVPNNIKYYAWRVRKDMSAAVLGNVEKTYEEGLEQALFETLRHLFVKTQ